MEPASSVSIPSLLQHKGPHCLWTPAQNLQLKEANISQRAKECSRRAREGCRVPHAAVDSKRQPAPQRQAQQNHRMAEAARDLSTSASPASAPSRVSHSRLSRAVSTQVLSTSKDGHSATSLGNMFQCLTTPPGKENPEFPGSHSMPVTSHPAPLRRVQLHLLCSLTPATHQRTPPPPRLLFPRLNAPSSLSLTPHHRCLSLLCITVALPWTPSCTGHAPPERNRGKGSPPLTSVAMLFPTAHQPEGPRAPSVLQSCLQGAQCPARPAG